MKVTKNYNINRAIEISLVSDTPLLLVSETKYLQDVDVLINKLNFVNFANYGNYMEAIKAEYFFNNDEPRGLELWQDVFERVSKAKNFHVIKTEFDSSSKSLLNNAVNRLSLNEVQVNSIKKIALDIAKLENSKTIKIEHVAEAIQYHCVNIDAYTQTIEFEIKYLEAKLKELNSAT